MTTLKINKYMQIIDIDSNASQERVVGCVKKDGHSYHFTPERLSVGAVRLPLRLTSEEQYQVDWIMDGLRNGGDV